MDEEESTVVSDNCDDCGQTIWYDPNNAFEPYSDDEDLSVEHECDPDEWDESEESEEVE